MGALRIVDVLDLAAAQTSDGEARLEKVFEWQFDRTMTSVRLAFGGAGSLLVALIAVLFRKDIRLHIWEAATILGSAGLLALYGSYMLWQARRLHREFLTALVLLSSLRPLGQLLARYRAES